MTYLGPEKKVGPSRGDKTHGPDSTSFRSRFFFLIQIYEPWVIEELGELASSRGLGVSFRLLWTNSFANA